MCIYLGGCIIEIRRLLQFLVGDQSIVVEMSVFIRDHSGGQFSWDVLLAEIQRVFSF